MSAKLLSDPKDIDAMRALLAELGGAATVVDFEESMQMDSVRSACGLWYKGNRLAAFSYVDDWDNLWFDSDPSLCDKAMEDEAVALAAETVRTRNGGSGTLDANCESSNAPRIEMLERNGFKATDSRTISYAFDLEAPLVDTPFPAGYSFRGVSGESEAEKLVALHRAAFGTDNMTLEERLAMMRVPDYDPSLDLVAVAPDGTLAGFCVCGTEGQGNSLEGFTDPVGTHPAHRRKGLGKSLLSAGLRALKTRGARKATLGTESGNAAMRGLAETAGFRKSSEKLWFSRSLAC